MTAPLILKDGYFVGICIYRCHMLVNVGIGSPAANKNNSLECISYSILLRHIRVLPTNLNL